jgi:dienelactone hydrolase
VLVELVQVTTRDGLRLDGMYQSATAPAALPLDALVFVHGTGGNFYSSTLFDLLAERARSLGIAVLRVNTRGHDLMSTAVTSRGGQRLGAAYEVVDDCRHDLAAWLAWLPQKGHSRLGLLGHSSGALKCLYALASEPELGAKCVLAISPPRLSYAWFCSSPEGPAFVETYTQADQLVQQGQPAALLDVKLPLPFVITAAGYVEKYGPDERYNFLRFIGRVPCPTLVILGGAEVEKNMAFRGLPEALAGLTRRPPLLTCQVVPGADHFYTGLRPELAECAFGWLRSLAE